MDEDRLYKKKGHWIESWYCGKCRSMFFTQGDDDPDIICPFCEHDILIPKSDRIMFNPNWDLEDRYLVEVE